ncbi:hypothetical protein M3A76_09395 [Corynebacterium sanguinis]|uniref:Uncharacterized protein n=1 Tax=Corynebacterium lipophiloflavum (strain ATCC 700352 / DSM 44291 / CCUG 37336 / JCM 10383 / DMMZ 1944) TaxID=525263 RepID=C0XR11_CORLD|nr:MULTISPECIES: hypothetical protein [Corynebacterium]EEI17360.1 hypothetical protein HMPREF0298_0881 [Corynebacterium lipophiloflavum DSM 44291]MCT1414666.1 hypothetical protein [Corynebacterium sanguinis]MCT1883234.1 hypothetical protein [Corynebacterium sanguinis]
MSTPYNGGPSSQDPFNNNEFGTGSSANNSPDSAAGAQGGSSVYGTPDNVAGSHNYGYNGYGSEQAAGYDPYDVNAASVNQGAAQLNGTTLVDGTYGDGTQPHPINNPAVNGYTHIKGTGKMNALEAWGYGFRQTFANWQTWIVIALLLILLPTLASAFIPFVGFLFGLAMLFLAPFLYSFALAQTLSKHWKFDGMKAPTYGSTLGMALLVGLISTLISLVFIVISAMIFGGSIMATLSAVDPAQLEGDPMAALPLIGAFFRIVALTAFLMLFVTPFLVFQVWYAADNACSFGDAFKEGFSAGARNYLQLLLATIIYMLLMIPVALTLGLGALIVVPAYYLALAYAYRQVSGGPVPTEAQI